MSISSKKASSADNQQERQDYYLGWITGFVDGEGCFSVGIFRNRILKNGWQVFPEFVVTQGEKSLFALEELQKFFGCGKIFVNRRHDNHKENVYRYCVRSINELRDVIVPFFIQNKLRTAKSKDFQNFVQALELIYKRDHLLTSGLQEIASIASKMNRKKPSAFLESSETTRQAPTRDARLEMI